MRDIESGERLYNHFQRFIFEISNITAAVSFVQETIICTDFEALAHFALAFIRGSS